MLQMAEQVSEFLLSTTLVGLCALNPIYALETLFGVCVVASLVTLFVKEDLRIYEIELREKRQALKETDELHELDEKLIDDE
jgi:hypothetical protein